MSIRSLIVGSIAGAALFAQTQSGAAAAVPGRTFARTAAVATQTVDFEVHLPLQNAAGLAQLIHLQSAPGSPLYHHFLTPAQFRASYGPSTNAVKAVTTALAANGLTITKLETQLIHVRGPVSAVERTFGTKLGATRSVTGAARLAATTRFTMPAALARAGATVAGLRRTMQPRPLIAHAKLPTSGAASDNRYSSVGPYWFDDLKQAYDYPANSVANGAGVTIATVGLSDFSDSDAKLYFNHERVGGGSGLAPVPKPQHVLLDGASAFDPNSGISDEANLDVQQSNGSALGAQVVGVSFGTQSEFLDAYSFLDEQNFADIVSTSYGQCELDYTAAYNNGQDFTGILQSYHDLFMQGNSEGITFIFSSGDEAGLGCAPPAYFGPGTGKTYKAVAGAGIWVDDPNVTGVGGTNLVTSYTKGSLNSGYITENSTADLIETPIDLYGSGNFLTGAYFGSGSGTSVIFPAPSYQKLVNTGSTMRTVPDVAMHEGGCPYFGPNVVVDCGVNDSADIAAVGGSFYGFIGTSASAPEFAGLLAIKESIQKSRLGNENEDIYQLSAENSSNASSPYFRQSQGGYNGVVKDALGRKGGYSRIIGNGTPIAKNFVLLPFAAAAGYPQTLSNP